MKIGYFIIIALLPAPLMGQITIGNNAIIAARGTIATNADINNVNTESSELNFEQAQLILTGGNQQLTTPSRIRIGNITIEGGGEKTLSGEWEITNSLSLNNGVITPASSGKVIFSGTESQQAIRVNVGSFVNGFFYTRGTGLRTFPVGYHSGNDGILAPAAFTNLTNGDDEIGVRVVNGDAQLLPSEDIEQVITSRHWEIDAPVPVNSPIMVGVNQLTLPEGALVVVQAAQTGGSAENLSGALNQPLFVTSASNVTLPIVTIGITRVFDILIHDLITPFVADDANDILFIENIHLTAENTVTLLDRWGVSHKVWKNYNNTDPQFDFTSLSPGNYICVVEYKLPDSSESKKKSQMVTVLRTN